MPVHDHAPPDRQHEPRRRGECRPATTLGDAGVDSACQEPARPGPEPAGNQGSDEEGAGDAPGETGGGYQVDDAAAAQAQETRGEAQPAAGQAASAQKPDGAVSAAPGVGNEAHAGIAHLPRSYAETVALLIIPRSQA